MPAHRVLPSLLVPILLFSACGGSGTARGVDRAPRPNADLITAEELSTLAGAGTLYDAVRTLRPAWLRRGQPTALLQQNEGALVVYVDGTRFGDIDSLRQLKPQGIAAIRYHSPGSAAGRFGPGHLQGAIEVLTLSQ